MNSISKTWKVLGYWVSGVLAVSFIGLLVAREVSHNTFDIVDFLFILGWFVCAGFATALLGRTTRFRVWPLVAPLSASVGLLILLYLLSALAQRKAPPGHAPAVAWGYYTFVYSCVGFFPALFSYYWFHRRLGMRSN